MSLAHSSGLLTETTCSYLRRLSDSVLVHLQVGYQITVAKFFLFFALNFELLLISETLGILCAGLHRNELVGMIILATFYVPLLMFTGFIQVSACSAAFLIRPMCPCT